MPTVAAKGLAGYPALRPQAGPNDPMFTKVRGEANGHGSRGRMAVEDGVLQVPGTGGVEEEVAYFLGRILKPLWC